MLVSFGAFVAMTGTGGSAGAQTARTQAPVVSTISTGPVVEDEAPARTMTLQEALAYARAHHLKILAAKQRLEAAKAEGEVASADWLPHVGALAEILGTTMNNSTASLLNQSVVDVPRVGATKVSGTPDWAPYPTTAVAIGVRQELYDFGRIAAEGAAASLQAEVERYRVASTDFDVAFGVAQAYYAVLAAAAIRDASRAAYDRAVQHRDLAKANVQSGLRPPIELTRAEADVARYEAGTTRAIGSLHIARSVLAAAIGADDLELDAAGELTKTGELTSLDDYVRRATNTPVVLEGHAKVEAQKAVTKSFDVKTRPNLFATASVSGRAGGATPSAGPVPSGDGWLPIVPNYDVGVVLSWPLLDPGWGRRADASRARENALASEADLTLRNQRAAIVAAWQEAKVSTSALSSLERGAEAAKANYDQADHRFAVGLGTSTELADAQAVRTEADIQLAIGRFQMARARAVLERAVAEVR